VVTPPTSGRARSVAEVVGAAALFGTTGTARALAPATASSASVGAVRLVLGGVGLLVVAPLVGGDRRRAIRQWRTWPGTLIGVLTATYQLAFFVAVGQHGVAVGTLITIGCGPIFSGLLGRALLREKLTRPWIAATAAATLGLFLLSGRSLTTADLGLAAGLAAGFSYALYTVISRRLILAGEAPATVLAGAFSLGGVLLLPVLLLTSKTWLNSASGIGIALWLAFGATTVAYVLLGRGLAHLGVGSVTTLLLAEPIVATILGMVVIGERLSSSQFSGLLLICGGVGLQGWSEVRLNQGESWT
jgi:DME family drug/metabolite transporter